MGRERKRMKKIIIPIIGALVALIIGILAGRATAPEPQGKPAQQAPAATLPPAPTPAAKQVPATAVAGTPAPVAAAAGVCVCQMPAAPEPAKKATKKGVTAKKSVAPFKKEVDVNTPATSNTVNAAPAWRFSAPAAAPQGRTAPIWVAPPQGTQAAVAPPTPAPAPAAAVGSAPCSGTVPELRLSGKVPAGEAVRRRMSISSNCGSTSSEVEQEDSTAAAVKAAAASVPNRSCGFLGLRTCVGLPAPRPVILAPAGGYPAGYGGAYGTSVNSVGAGGANTKFCMGVNPCNQP